MRVEDLCPDCALPKPGREHLDVDTRPPLWQAAGPGICESEALRAKHVFGLWRVPA